jgi:cytochrome o ubiquinol oxidase operon protein cyoD
MIDQHHGWNASLKPSIIGFILSLILIVAGYRFVTLEHLSGWPLTLTIFGFGTVQALVQLVFFLHLGMESKPHWNTIGFVFMAIVMVVVIGGSLWIMNSINYTMAPNY